MKLFIDKIVKILLPFTLMVLWAVVMPAKTYAGFGVSPSDIFNKHLRPGSVYEQEFIISQSNPDKDVHITIAPDMGDTNSWFSFEPGPNFTIPKGTQRFPMKVVITVPQDAKLQDYKGYIEIKAATGDEDQKTGVSIIKGATMEVNLVTTNVTVTRLIIQTLRLEDSNPGAPIKLYIKGRNEGNIGSAPTKVTMDITNLTGEPITSVETTALEEIRPGKEEEILAQFSASLQPGEYFANVKVYLGNNILREEKLVFKIIDQESVGKEVPQAQLAEVQPPLKNNILRNILSSDAVGITFALIVFCLATVASAKVLNKTIKTWKKVSLIAAILLAGVGLMVLLLRIYVNKDSIFVQRKPAVTATQPTPVPVTPQPSAEATLKVQGDSTEAKPAEPLTVTSKENILYKIYEKPDINSPVIYTATDGETFTKLQTQGDWYQVELPTGAWGWVHTSNLKK